MPLLLGLCAICFAATAPAANVLLQVSVSSSIFQSDGTTPLADGSIIHVIGSGDDLDDGFPMSGDDFISNQAGGDDAILAVTTIEASQLGVNGTFSLEFYYDSATFNYMYLRAFDTAENYPYPIGTVHWASSVLLQPSEGQVLFAGFSTVNQMSFTTESELQIQQFGTSEGGHTTVPEPGTGHLILLFMGGVLIYRATRGRGRLKLAEATIAPAPRDWI